MSAIQENDFYLFYKPKINHIVRSKTSPTIKDDDITSYNGAMYETYGDELDYIVNLVKFGKSKYIWTIIDGDNEQLIIVSGYHLVNRMGYLVTEKPWENQDNYVEE